VEEHVPAQAKGPPESSHFLIRRLHSLSGLIPVGVFLIMHLATNASILVPGKPGAEFQTSVERIHALGPLLIPVEIIGIFIPLLFHAIIGFQIIFTGKSNAQAYPYGGNIRYTLQRWTGIIAFFFIMYHVWQMHWIGKPLGGGNFALHTESGDPTGAFTTAAAIQSAWWISWFYAVGIIASVYHLANGIWTALITWGITIRPKAQRASGYACAAIGILVGALGLGALTGFKTFDATNPPPAATTAHTTAGDRL
jgi:succinate dehydrogenase / fumarate reductase, cytochrome b subunit